MPAQPILVGTTGACNNQNQGGPCTQKSTLVQLDWRTGQLIKVIGDVGFTVNGLAWDRQSKKLYATTAIGDTVFHGLITINLQTGAGTPVDANIVNFGLAGDPSPIHSITIGLLGNMVGWYDEFGEGVTDTFVRINKKTGVATEFTNTGIDTSQNGLAFGDFDLLLWNIDSPRFVGDATVLTQTAYLINPLNGKPLFSTQLSPPTPAALGDFNPRNNLYYGVDFEPDPVTKTKPAFIVVINPLTGTVKTLAQTIDNLHVITFIK
jgi:hypothetical protein